jgi:hypothetical protein
VGIDTQDSRVLFGCRQPVDFHYHSKSGIGLGDNQPLISGDKMLCLERLEWQSSGDHNQDGAIGVKCSPEINMGDSKIPSVTCGATNEGYPAQSAL